MRDDLDDYRIVSRIDGAPCEVYLFQRWSGYSHPVLPGDPLTHVEALYSPSICRAYVRELGGEPLMIRFECFAARNSHLSLPATLDPGLYSVDVSADGSAFPGKRLDRVTASMSEQVILVSEPDATQSSASMLRRLAWVSTYDYEYDADGVLLNAHVSSEQGRRTIRMSSRR